MPKRKAQRVEAAMLDAFEEQLTPEVSRRVLEFAKRRVAMMQVVGCDVAEDEARTLAQDAITDTLTSVTRWDHGAVPLAMHLRGVIRRRTAHRIARARQFPHRSVDVLGDAAGPIADASVVGELAPERPDVVFEAAEITDSVIASLLASTRTDPIVAAMIGAYVDGAATRLAVIEAAGISLTEFINGRRRLDRLLATLPDELRQMARDTMGRTP